MSKRKELIEKAPMPLGKQVKKKLDDWLNENVNLPLSKKGYPDTGAAISAALSAGGELVIPEDLADMAMAIVPGGALVKAGRKGMKVLKKAKDTSKQAPTLDYGKIKEEEKLARARKREAYDKVAETLEYKPSGDIVRKKPDLMSSGIRELERKNKLRTSRR